MMDTPGMDKWDKTFNKHEIVQELPEENGIKKQQNICLLNFL